MTAEGIFQNHELYSMGGPGEAPVDQHLREERQSQGPPAQVSALLCFGRGF